MNKQEQQGMTIIVKTVTRLTFGLILLYGAYIVLHGHVSPGGGFAGGVIIALAFINLMLAFGRDVTLKKISKGSTSFFESVGAILFFGIALLGFIGGCFFLNILPKGAPFRLFSAGIIPFCNIAIMLKVGAGIFAIFLALVLLETEAKERK